MASDADVQAVREMLGPDASAAGWTDVRIAADLDSGLHRYQVATNWWRYRASTTVNLVSVSESGSTRDLRSIHTNALALASMYDKLYSDYIASLVVVTPVVKGIVVHPIRRTGV